MLELLPEATWSISATTRPARPGEQDGVDYYFLSREEFDRRVREGRFLEHAEYLGNLYGTPAEPVRAALQAGKTVVMEIDVQGGIQVARKVPESLRFFILPPSERELERRLVGRATESAQQRQRRLEAARRELELARTSGCYPYFIVNDSLERAVDEIVEIIRQADRREQGPATCPNPPPRQGV